MILSRHLAATAVTHRPLLRCQRILLCHTGREKNSSHFSSPSLSLFLLSSRSTEQTRLVSLAQKCFKEHTSAGTGCEMWSTVGCLALHFSQRTVQKSGHIWKPGGWGGGGAKRSPSACSRPVLAAGFPVPPCLRACSPGKTERCPDLRVAPSKMAGICRVLVCSGQIGW